MRIIIKHLNAALLLTCLALITGCDKDNNEKKTDSNAKEIIFGSMTDIDGNSYKTVTIGSQTWMAENLKTTKYNDNTPIPNVTSKTEWEILTTGAYCNYNNDGSLDATYGKLYNWHAVNTSKLAPKGWHIPSYTEWIILKDYLIANGYNYDGSTIGNSIAKSLAYTSGWLISKSTGEIGNEQNTNNKSGFAALPGGCRVNDGSFFYIKSYCGFWSSSEYDTGASAFTLLYSNSYIDENRLAKVAGLSIRCVKD